MMPTSPDQSLRSRNPSTSGPRGGALIHVMKYRQRPAAMANLELESSGGRKPEVAADERELEGLLQRDGRRTHMRKFSPR